MASEPEESRSILASETSIRVERVLHRDAYVLVLAIEGEGGTRYEKRVPFGEHFEAVLAETRDEQIARGWVAHAQRVAELVRERGGGP